MSRRYAFTLIELLVVVSIIALLISILLPALGAARDAAKAVLCSSGQRQLLTADHNYVADYRGYFPPIHDKMVAGSGGNVWATYEDYRDYFGMAPVNSTNKLLWPEEFVCPEASRAQETGEDRGFSDQAEIGLAYGRNQSEFPAGPGGPDAVWVYCGIDVQSASETMTRSMGSGSSCIPGDQRRATTRTRPRCRA